MTAIVLSHDELRAAAKVVDTHLEQGCTTIAAVAHAMRTVSDMRATAAAAAGDDAEGTIRLSPFGTVAQRYLGRWRLIYRNGDIRWTSDSEYVETWPVIAGVDQ